MSFSFILLAVWPHDRNSEVIVWADAFPVRAFVVRNHECVASIYLPCVIEASFVGRRFCKMVSAVFETKS